MHIHVQTCTHIYMSVCVHSCVFVCVFVCVCVCVCMCVCAPQPVVLEEIQYRRKRTLEALAEFAHKASVDATKLKVCTALQHALQHTATHCNTLQRPATPCNTLPSSRAKPLLMPRNSRSASHTATPCNPHCNTLQRPATHCQTRVKPLLMPRISGSENKFT